MIKSAISGEHYKPWSSDSNKIKNKTQNSSTITTIKSTEAKSAAVKKKLDISKIMIDKERVPLPAATIATMEKQNN